MESNCNSETYESVKSKLEYNLAEAMPVYQSRNYALANRQDYTQRNYNWEISKNAKISIRIYCRKQKK